MLSSHLIALTVVCCPAFALIAPGSLQWAPEIRPYSVHSNIRKALTTNWEFETPDEFCQWNWAKHISRIGSTMNDQNVAKWTVQAINAATVRSDTEVDDANGQYPLLKEVEFCCTDMRGQIELILKKTFRALGLTAFRRPPKEELTYCWFRVRCKDDKVWQKWTVTEKSVYYRYTDRNTREKYRCVPPWDLAQPSLRKKPASKKSSWFRQEIPMVQSETHKSVEVISDSFGMDVV